MARRPRRDAPSQIAGRDALVVHPQEDQTGNAAGPGSGVPFPRRNSPRGGTASNSASGARSGAAAATVDTRGDDKENPLLRTLTDKELTAKKTDQPLAGLLYFIMEKQKMKDLEFTYGRKENRIALRFK